MLKLQAACWCSPAGTSLQGKGQKASGPCSCRSCYTGGSGRTAPCLAHLRGINAGLKGRLLDKLFFEIGKQGLYQDSHLQSQSLSLCGSEGPCRDPRLLGCPPRSAGGPIAQKRSDWRPDECKTGFIIKWLSAEHAWTASFLTCGVSRMLSSLTKPELELYLMYLPSI